MQQNAVRGAALARLDSFPPPARSSPGIMAEVEAILAHSAHPEAELAALQDQAWTVFLAQIQASQAPIPSIHYEPHITYTYAPRIHIEGSFNDDHSDRHTTTTTTTTHTPNWAMGYLCAALGAALYLGVLQSAYLAGRYDARPSVEVQP